MIKKISNIQGGFAGELSDGDFFGHSVADLGDIDGDGIGDLAVSAHLDDDGGENRGAVWILFMNKEGTVKSFQKISDIEGGFEGILDDGDEFGHEMSSIGDIDKDGVTDLAVGATRDDDGGINKGAVWILFLNKDGTVKSFQKISDTEGNFGGNLQALGEFGHSVTSLGDLNGDGTIDFAVGNEGDNDGGENRGAVWILFMNKEGTVKSFQKISDTHGGFEGKLDDFDYFGIMVTNIGDFDKDGVTDIAVGALRDDDGGENHGAFWILFLNKDGTVKSFQKISETEGGFEGYNEDDDRFGGVIANLGDLDNDAVDDFGVGAHRADNGGFDRGNFYFLYMNDNGTVKSFQKISETRGWFNDILEDNDQFGHEITSLGDLDKNGVIDIAVGAHLDDDGGENRGSFYILFLETTKIVKAFAKISDTKGGFEGDLDDFDFFGKSVINIGDLDRDGVTDIAVGAYNDEGGGWSQGSIYILFMNRDGTVRASQKISDIDGGFTGNLHNGDYFGYATANLGDLDGDGTQDIAVGAYHDDDGGNDRGAIWILFMNKDGTVKSNQKISCLSGGLHPNTLNPNIVDSPENLDPKKCPLDNEDEFSHSVGYIGDLDKDGINDLAVGTTFDDDGGKNKGAVYILFLNKDGTIKTYQKISDTQGFLSGPLNSGGVLSDNDDFGHAVISIGDLNEDGFQDLAVGSDFDGDGGPRRGAVHIIFMNQNGTVKSFQKISDTHGGFDGKLDDFDYFGVSIANLEDLDGDGVTDIAVGAEHDNCSGVYVMNNTKMFSEYSNLLKAHCDNPKAGEGALYILFLKKDGTVKSFEKISDVTGGFQGQLSNHDRFGHAVTNLGDLDGNGITDLAVGAHRDDDGCQRKTVDDSFQEKICGKGSTWILFLNEDFFDKYEKTKKISNNSVDYSNLPPYQQLRKGVAPNDIICSISFEILEKISSGVPVCVKSTSLEKLIGRGWGQMIN